VKEIRVVAPSSDGEPAKVMLSKVDPNPWQPRREFGPTNSMISSDRSARMDFSSR
jgi:hypothetical protein